MENLKSVLNSIDNFSHAIISNKEIKEVILKANLSKLEDVNEWLLAFGQSTATQWIVDKQRQQEPIKYILHKKWVCQHAAKNKQTNSERNTCCKSFIDILIKKNNRFTRRNDIYLKASPPLCATIKINFCHNHGIGTAGSLKFLRISPSVGAQFYQYFDDGLSPAQAIRAHENTLLLLENSTEAMADGSQNPIQRTVYSLYEKWRVEHFGTVSDPLQKLKEKISHYAEKDIFVAVKEERPWSVIVVTDVMKRAQSLPCSSEMIFMDSSSSCDSTQSTVTTVLTATKAGAVPIATLIHESQSAEGYISALSMLQEHFPKCFGGKEQPALFMTDDSAAEKSALRSLWPNSQQLLCHFHMAQAEWRWLISSTSGVDSNARKNLMHCFQNVMYADSDEKLEQSINAINSLNNNPKFVTRLFKNLERKSEWVQIYRNNMVTRHNNTNNYAEATIRILKDIILTRTKAFNVVALVEFCGSVWNSYFVGRLMNFANGRRPEPHLAYKAQCKKMQHIDLEQINQVDSVSYLVPNSKQDGKYSIDVSVGVCSCPRGREGDFCKHQAILHKHLGVMLPNLPPITAVERHELAQLALGSKCPAINFFQGLKESVDMTAGNVSNTSDSVIDEPSAMASDEIDRAERYTEDTSDASDALQSLCTQIARVRDLATERSAPHIAKFAKGLAKVRNESDLITSLIAMSASLATSRRRGGRIRVQPTSVARRRDGVSRGSRRIAMGRPSLAAAGSSNRTKKRGHKLSSSVAANVAHAKSHGQGH